MSQRRRSKYVNASELGEYVYCSRSWWLRHVAGETGDAALFAERTTRGERGHAAHGRQVQAYQRDQRIGYWLLIVAALLAVALLISLL